MTSTKTVAVNASELRTAFDFVSFGAPLENSAYICLVTGRIYWQSALSDLEDEEDLPDDLETSDRYLAVPHRNDLDLGRRLALSFVERELPDDINTVVGSFRRRGAYARFKDLLHARGLLDRWYDFESRATDEALLAWCGENGILLVDEQPGTTPDR
jgi:hypothetical protein